jgi:hypothetical protein
MRKVLVTLAAVAVAVAGFAAPVDARRKSQPLKGEGEGLKIIANVPYSGGTDMEFTTIKGRDYAFTGSWSPVKDGGGLHVIDVTKPEKPKEVAWLKCAFSQNDIQITHDNKYVIQAADSAGGPESCLGVGKEGFQLNDIRNPKKPKPVGFAETGSSHNTTAHPTKPYVYNSNSSLAGKTEIQIWNIKNPKKPKMIGTVPSVPHAPHDIAFNKKGTMAVTAAISHWDIWDTKDPENPTLLWSGQCPGCSITHDAKFLPDDSGVVIGDEGGGGGGYPCPGGALYFYSLQGGRVPVLQGVYEPDEFVVARDGQTGVDGCTSHVFDINDEGSHISISWYSAGTRYLDISGYTGMTVGGNNNPGAVVEAGWFMPDGGKSWSSKFYKGKYIYSNDMNRGFDVFKIKGK